MGSGGSGGASQGSGSLLAPWPPGHNNNNVISQAVSAFPSVPEDRIIFLLSQIITVITANIN